MNLSVRDERMARSKAMRRDARTRLVERPGVAPQRRFGGTGVDALAKGAA